MTINAIVTLTKTDKRQIPPGTEQTVSMTYPFSTVNLVASSARVCKHAPASGEIQACANRYGPEEVSRKRSGELSSSWTKANKSISQQQLLRGWAVMRRSRLTRCEPRPMAARPGGLQEPNSKLNRSTRVWRQSGVRMNLRDKAICPFEEEQHQVRLAKSARLRELRSHASWLAFDSHAQFHDEIDLSAIFEENALHPRLSRGVRPRDFSRN